MLFKVLSGAAMLRKPLCTLVNKSKIGEQMTTVFNIMFPHPQIKYSDFSQEQRIHAQQVVEKALSKSLKV